MSNVRELLKSNLTKRKAEAAPETAKKAKIDDYIDPKETELIDKEFEIFQQEIQQLEPTPKPKVAKKTETELINDSLELKQFQEKEERERLTLKFEKLRNKRTRIPKQNTKARPRLWSRSDQDSSEE